MTIQPELQCHCTCPPPDTCRCVYKHAVAVAFIAEWAASGCRDETSDEQVLRRYFSEKSAEELIELLLQAIQRDEQQWRSWLLKSKVVTK